MRQHRIVLLPGDGIGPEITQVTRNLLEVVSKKHNFQLDFQEELFGGAAIEAKGIPLPPSTLKSCKDSDAILLACIGDPKFDSYPRETRPESGLLDLRANLDLYANLRPVKVFPALIKSSTLKDEIIKDVDLIVVRELTSGIYFGKPNGRIKTETGERAFNTMTYSSTEVNRIAKIAFELAKVRKQKLCSVDKANVLEVSQLWRDEINNMSKNYEDVVINHLYVDNAAMQLIRCPSQFDVIVTGNLFGDILSDEAAMLTGSIGMLPSASLGNKGPGLFEPVHGSAPDIAGLNQANPIAMVLSAAMMMKIGLKESEAAISIENAVEKVLDEGFRTKDIEGQSIKKVSCKEMGDQLIKAI